MYILPSFLLSFFPSFLLSFFPSFLLSFLPSFHNDNHIEFVVGCRAQTVRPILTVMAQTTRIFMGVHPPSSHFFLVLCFHPLLAEKLQNSMLNFHIKIQI